MKHGVDLRPGEFRWDETPVAGMGESDRSAVQPPLTLASRLEQQCNF